ncbi:MAG: hypothetical protein AB1847_05110 [bacterium]
MKKKCLVFITLFVGFMVLAGCGGGLSRLEADYGTSYALAKRNQTLNPDAGEKPAPAACRLDGQAAQKTVEKYQKGFGCQTEASSHAVGISIGK